MNEIRNQLIMYKSAIQDFEYTYVKDNFNNYIKYDEHRGYLINLENYKDLKMKINKLINDPFIETSSSIATNDLHILKSIEFKTSSYLINMLFNKNEYIIINTHLWKLFGENEGKNAKILYKIEKSIISLSLDDGIELKFKCYNFDNIINNSSFTSDLNRNFNDLHSNFQDIEKIYKSLDEYSKIEDDIKVKLKKNYTLGIEYGYLIEENWIQKWMKLTNYLKLKQDFQDFKDSKKIKDIIINYEEKNRKVKNNLNKIETKGFKNKAEIEQFLEKSSLILVKSCFIQCFTKDYNINDIISYKIYNNKIEIILRDDNLIVQSESNIIKFKENKIDLERDESNLVEIHLKILIRIYSFQKELESHIKSEFYQKNNQKNKIYFINKNWMNQYKKFFDYSMLCELLDKIPIDTDNNFNNKEMDYQNLIQLINVSNKGYLEEINKKISLNQLKFTEEYNDMKYKVYKDDNNKSIKYLVNFGIINEEIISILEENKIISKEKLLIGKFIAERNKIFFNFTKDSKNYFQINSFDKNTDEFIIEYIIESEFDFVINYFKENGIIRLLSKISGNKIFISNSPICNCYKIMINDTQDKESEQNDNIPFDENKLKSDEINIFSLLISYSLFLKDIQKKCNEFQVFKNQSQAIPQIENYYLVNKNIIEDFFDSFWDEKVNEIIFKYSLSYERNIDDTKLKQIIQDKISLNCIQNIIDKKDTFKLRVKYKDIYQIETQYVIEKSSIFIYPRDLMFFDKSLTLRFISLFELLNDAQNEKNAKIVVNFNNGNLIFKGDAINFLNNSNHLIFVYSPDKNSMKGINFYLELILSFNHYSDIINNNFNDLLKNNILSCCMNFRDNFEKKFKLKIVLINKKIDNKNQNENKLYEYLEILVNLYKEYLILKKNINKPINDPSNFSFKKEDYYLIHKNFIKDFGDITHFTEIKTIIDNSNQFYIDFEINKKDCLNKMKIYLQDETKEVLKNLNDNLNLKQLKNIQIYKLEKNLFKTKYIYYQNAIIINNKIKELLSNFVKLISNIIEPVECHFDNNKIFINFHSYIAIGNIEERNQLIFSHFIQPEHSSDFSIIMEKIKNEGYKLVQKGLVFRKLEFKSYYGYNIEAEIVNVSQQNQINKSSISEKLKKLILLCLGLQNNGDFGLNDKLAEDVYLITPEILSDPCIGEIISLLQNNNEINKLLRKLNFPKKDLNSTQLEELISYLDEQKLKQIDNKYRNKTFQFLELKGQKMTLKNGKDIIIYRNFIMIRKNIFLNISTELGLNNNPKVFYSKNKEGDLIIDENKESITFGRIDENDFFNVNYIFYFSYCRDLEDELKIINQYGIKKYLDDYTVFNKENSNDYISPIFSNKNILGKVYRVSPGISNYMNKMDYSAYLENSNLVRAYSLYDYYENFKEKKISYNFSLNKEYYLIKKQTMNDIKKLYYYKDIKEILNKLNPNERKQSYQSKILLYLLKHLSDNIFEEFIRERNEIKAKEKSLMEPDIEPVYGNREQPFMIYKDFEMIEPEIAKKFFKDLNEGSYFSLSDKDNNLIECTLKNGKVMIKYSENLFNNQKDIVAIGNINNDYTFINEYVLIYNKYFSFHMNELEKTNLNKYLSELKFCNNQSPIVINQVNEIGTIIKLNPQINNGNFDNNHNRMDIDKKDSELNKPYGSNDNFDGKDTDKENDGYGKDGDNYDDFDYDFESDVGDEYNLNPPKKYNSVKECFIYPPLIGLDNIGATCYMNATLQCLCNIQKFVDYFKFNPHLINIVKNDKDKSKLCSSFKLLIENLWPDPDKKNKKKSKTSLGYNRFFPYQISNKYESANFYGGNNNNKSYPPEEFKKKISKMNPLFEGVAANDAKDLVQFLIMTLHQELNKPGGINLNNAINQDQRNKQLMFKIFAQDFMNSNKSIISDLFYGVNYNITQCGFCGTQSFNYQTYFFLIFPLEEVRIFKSQNNFNYNYNCFANNEVNIYDCFFYDQKINYMTGSNIMYCNVCRQTCNTSMRTILSTGPEILIIILNRGQGIEYNVKINFLEEINLENFIEMKQTGCIYKLIGVITHIGESGMGGHFIAYSKNPISNEWNKYNDSIVTPVNNFQKDVIDFAMPYLLFYQKSS